MALPPGRAARSNWPPRIAHDTSPLPPVAATEAEDEALFADYPWVDAPITKIDYGYNVR